MLEIDYYMLNVTKRMSFQPSITKVIWLAQGMFVLFLVLVALVLV